MRSCRSAFIAVFASFGIPTVSSSSRKISKLTSWIRYERPICVFSHLFLFWMYRHISLFTIFSLIIKVSSRTEQYRPIVSLHPTGLWQTLTKPSFAFHYSQNPLAKQLIPSISQDPHHQWLAVRPSPSAVPIVDRLGLIPSRPSLYNRHHVLGYDIPS